MPDVMYVIYVKYVIYDIHVIYDIFDMYGNKHKPYVCMTIWVSKEVYLRNVGKIILVKKYKKPDTP